MGVYDDILQRLFRCIRSSEDGIVGAAILDGEKRTLATSSATDDGKYKHAERNVVEGFVSEHGAPSSSAIAVTTLSPCKRASPHRVGESCTDVLLSHSINRVHTGYIDPWQLSVAEYEKEGLRITTTNNPEYAAICRRLFEYFERVDDGEDINAVTHAQKVIPENI